MKKTITYITTVDTKETFQYPRTDNKQQPVYEVSVYFKLVSNSTGHAEVVGTYSQPGAIFYITRDTLKKIGHFKPGENEVVKNDLPDETIEDLILRLLEMVGVYPNN